MNAIQRMFARLALRRLKEELNKLDDKKIAEVATRLNAKVDIPKLSEATEYKAIYNTLSVSIDTARELLNLIKV